MAVARLTAALAGAAGAAAVYVWLDSKRRQQQCAEVDEAFAEQCEPPSEASEAQAEATEADADLSAMLTVICTTSPSPVHPSCEVIMQVFDSLDHYAPALATCRTIVVCDGCNVHPRCKYRSGMVDQAALERYQEYKRQLRTELAGRAAGGGVPATAAPPPESAAAAGTEPVPGGRFELLELSSRHGFGYAVRAALALVKTPLVCVLQHDRTCLRRVGVGEIARAVLESEGRVGYVLLPTRATRNYHLQMSSRMGLRGVKLRGGLEENARPLRTPRRRLLPCLQWYDSTHVASVAFYRELFARHPGIGGFIESKLGPLMFADYAERGCAAAVQTWRCYLYDDGGEPMVGHLNGSSALPLAELDAAHGANPGRTGTVGRRWRPADAEASSDG